MKILHGYTIMCRSGKKIRISVINKTLSSYKIYNFNVGKYMMLDINFVGTETAMFTIHADHGKENLVQILLDGQRGTKAV